MIATKAYTDNDILLMLHGKNVRPSVHRMAVMNYIANMKTHPTAEEIFTTMTELFPSVSRTTVYNSLHTLVGAGLLRELEIEGVATRYDLALQMPHSHFRCTCCGKIFDMTLPERIDNVVSPGFKVNFVDLKFDGLCPECIKLT